VTEKLIPENELERLLAHAQLQKSDFREFIRFFLKANIFIPSATEVMPDGTGLEPLLFDKKGTQMLGVFTSAGRVSLYKSHFFFCLSMKARDFIARMPKTSALLLIPVSISDLRWLLQG
jgi:hypothetical protein